ncbi:hypothetical protein Scep_025116 [Stephania cephalantha]|uniref:Uncharacterized protein n=1 Tax=Stephania cephalantha TaxID=152367 RepID=A0AAP0EMV4_9MAGN
MSWYIFPFLHSSFRARKDCQILWLTTRVDTGSSGESIRRYPSCIFCPLENILISVKYLAYLSKHSGCAHKLSVGAEPTNTVLHI